MKKIIYALAICLIALGLYKKANATNWTESTEAKYETLKSLGFPREVAYATVSECKKAAKNPTNCIKLLASILGAESSMGTRCHNNNCVGMNDGAKPYNSKTEGIAHWVKQYNKFWYKQSTPSSFYRNDGIPPITHYCMGKKKDGVCKEGTKNSWKVFNSLSF